MIFLLVCLEEERRKLGDGLAIGGLKEGKGSDGNHREATILDLKLIHILSHALEVKGVESKVSGDIALRFVSTPEDSSVIHGTALDQTCHKDANNKDARGIKGVEASVEKSRSSVTIGEDGGQVQSGSDLLVKKLGHGPSHGGQHRQTRVLQLSLSHPEQGLLALGEAKGIEANISGHGAIQHLRGLHASDGEPLGGESDSSNRSRGNRHRSSRLSDRLLSHRLGLHSRQLESLTAGLSATEGVHNELRYPGEVS